MEYHHTYKWSTVDDLLAFAAEELRVSDEDDMPDAVSHALELAATLAQITESQGGEPAGARLVAAQELQRQVDDHNGEQIAQLEQYIERMNGRLDRSSLV